MKRMIGVALLAVAGLALLSGCKKDPFSDMTEEESRIYITNRDSSVAFTSYKTYSIVDSVSVIDNNRVTERGTTSWDLQVLNAVRTAMEARGYVRVPHTQSPNLGINVSRIYNTTTNVVNFNNFYGGYGGFYDPFYWGYGGYGYNFPSYGFYQSTDAALSIDILDLKNASSNRTIKGIWNGLIRGSGIFKSASVNSQVQALFDQSPYMNTVQ